METENISGGGRQLPPLPPPGYAPAAEPMLPKRPVLGFTAVPVLFVF